MGGKKRRSRYIIVKMGDRRKRSKYEIVHDILEAISPGENIMYIMYKSNLSYTVTRKYVDRLKAKGLIMQKDRTYYLTEKGIKLLDVLKQYKQKKEELKQLLQNIAELYGE